MRFQAARRYAPASYRLGRRLVASDLILVSLVQRDVISQDVDPSPVAGELDLQLAPRLRVHLGDPSRRIGKEVIGDQRGAEEARDALVERTLKCWQVHVRGEAVARAQEAEVPLDCIRRSGDMLIKHGGLLPILDLARYAALKADARVTSTVERLRVAGQAGALDLAHAGTLAEAYDLFAALRLEHQVHQLEQGVEPDDYLDPKELNPLTRRYLRDAFREVASVQKSLMGELTWGT